MILRIDYTYHRLCSSVLMPLNWVWRALSLNCIWDLCLMRGKIYTHHTSHITHHTYILHTSSHTHITSHTHHIDECMMYFPVWYMYDVCVWCVCDMYACDVCVWCVCDVYVCVYGFRIITHTHTSELPNAYTSSLASSSVRQAHGFRICYLN